MPVLLALENVWLEVAAEDDETLLALDGAWLEILLAALDELAAVVKILASCAVALMPYSLLKRISPQVLKLSGFQLVTISRLVQQPPLPDQLQPK